MNYPLLGLIAPLLLLAAVARADDGRAERRSPPRIIFGESEATDFEFRRLPPLRRSAASSRQAYFGSGTLYSETLARLQARMQAITSRAQLDRLELTPAQEAAKDEMTPALVRALALSRRARDAATD